MASFMEMALEEARAAGERGEVPVGCVVVRDGAVVARAGNRTVMDHDPTAHAEIVAIRVASEALELGAADRLRPLRHARALYDVRRRGRVRADTPPLLRGR